MQLKIQNGAVELSGEPILHSVNIEINDTGKIAVIGRNGCGKTTLLKLIAGEYDLSKNSSDQNSFFAVSGKPKIGTLSQMAFENDSLTLLDEIRSVYREMIERKALLDKAQAEMEIEQSEENIKRYSALLEEFRLQGGFYFEREYESALKRFGFSEEEKGKRLSEFSGGQRTKIAFLKLLLSTPDILLLDEPTNHLDMDAVEWLEDYLINYKKAFVVVSHDRMFLDRVVTCVYEIEHGKTERYAGNYTAYALEKEKRRAEREKAYSAQQKELERLTLLTDRFRYKATKAAMVQSKLKQMERTEKIERPEQSDRRTFHVNLEAQTPAAKDILSLRELTIGYRQALGKLDLEIKRGDRVGIIGGNGLGKSTLVKTLMGQLPPLGGSYQFGTGAKIGYFDQQMALYTGHHTVLADYQSAFPADTDFEARSMLGGFLFSGEDVFKTVDMLSGGERVRLALCKLFRTNPNFLILDEPTNHMDIIGKETLENLLSDYQGTILFVSHDRYFVKKLADKLIVFENNEVHFFPFGYEEYQKRKKAEETPAKEDSPAVKKVKKTFTTPLKERSKLEKAIAKAEEKIKTVETRIKLWQNELQKEENAADYMKLSDLQSRIAEAETELETFLSEWESLNDDYERLKTQ